VRFAVLTIGCLVGALVLGVSLVPEGEVATLATRSSDGLSHETQVWVVEGASLADGAHGEIFLRAHSARAEWLERLRERPRVRLQRDGVERRYRAEVEDDPGLRARVNRAMAKKYGVSDRLLAWIVDPASSVPVRLVPDSSRESAAREPAEPHAPPE
jgi:hypothetical protein